MSVRIIHTKNLKWLDVINPGDKEIAYLKKHFDFHPLDYEDVIQASQHPKIDEYEEYCFIVLLFAVYNRKTGEILPAEVDLFVGKDYVITIHDGSMYTMLSLFETAGKLSDERRKLMSKGPGFLLYSILEKLFKRSFPMLDHISTDMSEIEKTIFSDNSLIMSERISSMKRNIIDFRRIMKTHHLIMKRLAGKKSAFLIFQDSRNYYDNLLEHAENIWDILAIQKETVDALQEASQSLATNKLNQVTKIVAITSALFLPATFILFLFGLSVKDMPFISSPHGFWIILGISIISSVIMVLIYKLKRWF